MKKLIVNGLLIVGFFAVVIGLFMGLAQLRAVDDTEAAADAYDYLAAYQAEIAIQEESGVTVAVHDTEQSKTTEEAPESTDVDDFLNSLD